MARNASPVTSSTIHRKPPYLHRNWLAAMGSNIRQADHEDDDHRPAKRRRVIENSPDSGIGLEALDAVSLTSENGQVEKAMRIEVLKVVHKDSSRVRTNLFNGPVPLQVSDGFDAKARCRIFISGHGDNGSEHQLLVDSQICTIKTYKNPAGPSRMVRIHLPHPFHVPQDKILVPRDDDDVFGLAERYSARIQLESAGDPNWPPEFLNSSVENLGSEAVNQATPRRQWILHAVIQDLFQCHRKTVTLSIAKGPNPLLATDYVLDVDVRWASALSAKTMKRLDKDVRPSITCFGEGDLMDLDTPATNGVNGVNGHANGINGVNGTNGVTDHDVNGELANGELMDDMDDQAEGDLTPGRRRRPRPQINYNLKLLSDKAQKKDRKKRHGQRPKNGTADADDCGVTYLFQEQFHQDDFTCILCAVPLPSFELLRAHYKLTHDDYAFEFQLHPRIVSISRIFGHPGTPLKPEVYQLGLPRGPLDLPAYLEGDESWITSRQGSENGREIGPLRTVAPRPVRDEDNLVPAGQPKKIIVPKTRTTLYHPLSKAPLEPGTEMDRFIADESWLIHKHRDTLGDFTDVDENEKEFMKVWDAYFLPLHISSELYLPPHYLAFAREKAPWIVAKISRAIEFSKHMSVLQIRGVINDSHMNKALSFIQAAREAREAREKAGEKVEEQELVEQPAKTPKNAENVCARCEKFVERGPAWLCCSEPNCKKPLYHDFCATENTWPTNDRDNWKCNDCV
ncbi:hypothetical protein CONLIGDRAFT_634088 [Coniochaeta ligniaria NRRL 30616]|uniref:C2H2-type domain-containing protein n=1 Tax=Coniochaeta ligniaria NRRL 30616 TaxID=1408157 RepID=A0A1J7IKC9_9PEZI|nr:hypothetical protein CONLIGDRAFT_634088 [Coniochaeta ligniaria NRRL 30616]